MVRRGEDASAGKDGLTQLIYQGLCNEITGGKLRPVTE